MGTKVELTEKYERFTEESGLPSWVMVYLDHWLSWGVCRDCLPDDIKPTALLDGRCGLCWRKAERSTP